MLTCVFLARQDVGQLHPATDACGWSGSPNIKGLISQSQTLYELHVPYSQVQA